MATNLGKLYTHEDTYNIHKILGVFCFSHFIYRFFLKVMYDTMFLQTNKTTSLCVCAHAVLSASSFIFHIPKRKVASRVVIWEETRVHSLIFTMRSIVVMLLIALYKNTGWEILLCARGAVVVATMLLADSVSDYYKRINIINKDDSVMRKLPYPENISKHTVSQLKYFYSVSQIGATLICLISTNIDSVFILLFPIQVSMLLSTLNKKGIITMRDWHIGYSGTLLLVFLHDLLCTADTRMSCNLFIYTCYILVIFFRFYCHYNKYTIWTIASIISIYYTKKSGCFIPDV